MSELERKLVGKECKFVTYCPPFEPGGSDMHVVKEVAHYSDGTTEPTVKLIEDFKRPFYITKKGARNHEQKKEWEKVDNLIEYRTTQSKIVESVSRAIGEPWFKGNMRKLCRNPYIYGTDILSTAIIKKMYQQKYNNLFSIYRYATFDTETDVVGQCGNDEEIICATLTMEDKVYTVISKKWLGGVINVDEQVQHAARKYIGDTVERRKLKIEVEMAENDTDIVLKIFKKAHIWKPDIIGIWNMIFDIRKVEQALARAGINPADVFSDPVVPKEFRRYEFKEGPMQTVTSSGVLKSLKFNERWHTLYAPASFYFVDAACVYTKIRTGAQNEQSYGLDAIAKKHEVDGKLRFKDAEHLVEGSLDWHRYMQVYHKIEYVIYNMQDCIIMLDLDEKTKDIEISFAVYSGCSDFEHFKSQPRRSVDRLHWFCLEHGYVIGSTSNEMATEHDDMTLDNNDWIITLPAHLVMDNGLKIIAENELLSSNIRTHVGD